MLAVLLVTLQAKAGRDRYMLGILAHQCLSLGLVAVSFLDNVRVDLMSYLFGDLLAVSPTDLVFIYAGAGVIGLVLAIFWRPLLSTTVNEDLAAVDGINIDLMPDSNATGRHRDCGWYVKFVGALIMTSLLIIPAATARESSQVHLNKWRCSLRLLALSQYVVSWAYLGSTTHQQAHLLWSVLLQCLCYISDGENPSVVIRFVSRISYLVSRISYLVSRIIESIQKRLGHRPSLSIFIA